MSLMKVEKVPDSTYDMVGGLDQQIREIKEVSCQRASFLGLLVACQASMHRGPHAVADPPSCCD